MSANGNSNTNYKIIYFDCRALAEPARLMLNYADVPFEDFRISYPLKGGDPKVWEQMKPKMPYGQTPILEFDDAQGKRQQLAQSQTICRYLGKIFGLAGQSEFEQIKVDELAEWYKDIGRDFGPYVILAHGQQYREVLGLQNTTKEKYFEEKIVPLVKDRFVPIIMGKLKESGSGFLFPFGLSWVDFFIADFCTTLSYVEMLDFFGTYKEMAQYTERVYSANSTLEKYVERRPLSYW